MRIANMGAATGYKGGVANREYHFTGNLLGGVANDVAILSFDGFPDVHLPS